MSSTSASNGSDDTSAGEEAGTGTDTASQTRPGAAVSAA